MSLVRRFFLASLLLALSMLFAASFASANVSRSGSAPVLNPIGNKITSEGQELQFTISATDPESDPLTYSADFLPAGATFDAATHTFTWTPEYGQQGYYSSVHFEVSDGSSTSFENISIEVDPGPVADTKTTVSVGKSSSKVKVSGAVTPDPKGSVKVSLYKRFDGHFRKVDVDDAKLGGNGYKTAFERHPGGTCKVTANFKGADAFAPSTKSKTFGC